jgi:hypothetical protein
MEISADGSTKKTKPKQSQTNRTKEPAGSEKECRAV